MATTLSPLLLEALLAHEPEIPWSVQDAAPVPARNIPSSFLPRYSSSSSFRYGNGDGTVNNDDDPRPKRQKTGARLPADKRNRNDFAGSPVFPWGYELPLPPALLAPLLLLTAASSKPAEVADPPRSSIIVSPYLRIPPYTFCARVSTNWRIVKDIRRPCELNFLPYFGEDGYADENGFRDAVNASGGKIRFVLPNEEEGEGVEEEDEEEGSGDEEQRLSRARWNKVRRERETICGICLSVGCIVHHQAEAVPQPVINTDEAFLSSLSRSLSQQSNHSNTPHGPSAQPLSSFTLASRQARHKNRGERTFSGCDKGCIYHYTETSLHAADSSASEHERDGRRGAGRANGSGLAAARKRPEALEEWPESDQKALVKLLFTLTTSENDSSISALASSSTLGASSPTPPSSCIVAAYLPPTRTCTEVDLAIRRILGSSTSTTNGSSGRTPDYFASERKEAKQRTQLDRQAERKALAAALEPYWEDTGGAEPDGQFSADETALRAPRTGYPYAPCYHPGRLCSDFTGDEDQRVRGAYCSCTSNRTWCDQGCGCALDCPVRFKGCDCALSNRECKAAYESTNNEVTGGPSTSLVVPGAPGSASLLSGGKTYMHSLNGGCPCIESARECHIDLCARHDKKSCRAMTVQDDRAIRTFIAASELEGYGLFVGEDAPNSRVLIGEYRGEVINEHEADMRSLLYQTRNRSFLFDLTKIGIVDGLRIGNKARYMNTSRNGRNNTLGASTQINGETRLVLYAEKLKTGPADGAGGAGRGKLMRNDELLLDYGVNFEVFGEDD